MERPTMSILELAEKMRANLIPVSEEKLGRMICEGKLPFAVGLEARDGEKNCYLIFRHAFYEWLDAMAGPGLNEVRPEGRKS